MNKNTPRYYKDLIWEFTKSELKLRYNGSFLGFVWVFLKPFATFAIIILVFSLLFKQHDPHYKFNLLVGLTFFTFFAESTSNIMVVLLARSDLILKLNFPRSAILVSSLLVSLVNFVASLAFFFILALFYSSSIQAISFSGVITFFIIILIFSLFILAFGFFASIIQIHFRDLQSIWALFLQLLMYGTPIIYPMNILPASMQKLMSYNPLAFTIETARKSFLDSSSGISIKFIIFIFLAAVFLNILGYLYFNSQIKKAAEYF